jgi:multidrug efflux pump
MLSARLFRQDVDSKPLERVVGKGLSRLSGLYGRALSPALNHPIITVATGASVIVAAFFAYTTLSTEIAPDEDRGSLTIFLLGPEGSSSAFISEQMEQVEALVQEVSGPDGPVSSVLSTLSIGNAGQGDPAVGMITVVLKDWSEREEDGLAFQSRVQEALSPVTAVRLFVLAPNGLAIAGRPIDIALRGADRETLAGWADQLVARSGDVPGVFAMWSDYSDRNPQLSISIDRSRANALGLDARQIGETLQIMFGASAITRFVDRGVEYDVLVESRDRPVPSDIESVFVRAGNGTLVPLSSVVTITETSAPGELQRIDRQPAVLVGGGLWGGSVGTALSTIVDIADETLPEQASISFVGQSLDFHESGAGFILILALILLLSHFVLAAQFESFVDPIVILIAAPASMAGWVLALYFAGLTVNVYTQIAMLLLIGLVAKNAILLIEFAKQRREEGIAAREAIFEACTIRLRPILMTTVATIIGAIPLMFETGAGGHARFSVGLVIACGTTIGTLLTLFVVPTVYLALSRFTRPRNEVALQLTRMRSDELSAASPGVAP